MNTYEEDINEICNQYGAKFTFDHFSCRITFKNGKYLIYGMINQGKTVDNILKNAKSIIMSDAHGRVFDKDNHFIGYVSSNKSIDEVMIEADLM